MPCSTMDIASRHSACCRRLATKPGASLWTRTGSLPAARRTSIVRSTVTADVRSPCTTSTSGLRYGDRVAGAGEDLGDAVPHEAGADDRYLFGRGAYHRGPRRPHGARHRPG